MKLQELTILDRVLSAAIEELGREGLDVYSLTAKTEDGNKGRWNVTVNNVEQITSQRMS